MVDWNRNTDLCTIGTTSNKAKITDKLVLQNLRRVCWIHGGKMTFGFKLEEIGNKSLCSGAAMALAMSNKNHNKIKIMILGRGKSNAFMAYIHPQVLELTSNLSEDMIGTSGTDLTNTTQDRRKQIGNMRLDF